MGFEHDTLLRLREQWLDAETDSIEATTSGSTGEPKPIRLPKHDMKASAEATCRRFGIGPDSVLALPLSLSYIAGKMMAVRSFVSGAQLLLLPPSTEPLAAVSDDVHRIYLLSIVPSQVDGLLRYSRPEIIRNVLVGGAPLSQEQEAKLREAPFRAYATYGMTETCSHVALRSITDGEEYFTAIPGITFATDERGCLVVIAPAMSFGRLVTNDVVRLTDAEHFVWQGRYDCIINSGGIKIHPESVERSLLALIGNTDFMITSRPSDKWGEEVVIMVEESCSMTDDEIIAGARNLLPRYSVPKAVVRVSAIPRTSNGKIRRNFEKY